MKIQTHMLVHLDIQAVRHLVILQQKKISYDIFRYISVINHVSMYDLQYFVGKMVILPRTESHRG